MFNIKDIIWQPYFQLLYFNYKIFEDNGRISLLYPNSILY